MIPLLRHPAFRQLASASAPMARMRPVFITAILSARSIVERRWSDDEYDFALIWSFRWRLRSLSFALSSAEVASSNIKNLRVFIQRARDGDTLMLPAAEGLRRTKLGRCKFHPFIELYELIGVGEFQRSSMTRCLPNSRRSHCLCARS